MALAHLILNNRYELIKPLGQGGMARVYLARDRFLGRQVAVKILHPSLSDDNRFLARFRREAEAAAALNHPHIISVYDVGNDGDIYYIIMEYVDGLDLKELLIRNGPLPVRRAADIGFQVASALQYAHDHGLVHRDIKPHNIMVAPSGLVKVADFGIAKVLNEVPISDEANTIGTAQYISPEQAQNGSITPKTDVYSLGVVLYEAVTGFLPFPGDNAVSIALAHVEQEPIAPSVLHTDVSPELDEIILKAMAKQPKDRFASADAMARALEDWERNAGRAGQAQLSQDGPGSHQKRERPAAPVASTSRMRGDRGCIVKIVGAVTILAILSVVPGTLWVLQNVPIGVSFVQPAQTSTPVVRPAIVTNPSPSVTPTSTSTPLPTAGPTRPPAPTATLPPRPTYGNTPTPTPTNTPTPTPTNTPTPTPTPTNTPVPTATPVPTDTPTATPTKPPPPSKKGGGNPAPKNPKPGR